MQTITLHPSHNFLNHIALLVHHLHRGQTYFIPPQTLPWLPFTPSLYLTNLKAFILQVTRKLSRRWVLPTVHFLLARSGPSSPVYERANRAVILAVMVPHPVHGEEVQALVTSELQSPPLTFKTRPQRQVRRHARLSLTRLPQNGIQPVSSTCSRVSCLSSTRFRHPPLRSQTLRLQLDDQVIASHKIHIKPCYHGQMAMAQFVRGCLPLARRLLA